MSVKSRVSGLIIGTAAGDKNKGPCQMSLKLLQSLLNCQCEYNTEAVLFNYMQWYFGKGTGWHDTGPTAGSVFRTVSRMVPNWSSMTNFDKNILSLVAFDASQALTEQGGGGGVNAAHRSTPLALIPFLTSETISDSDLADLSRKESMLTHWSSWSREVCAAIVTICRHLIRGESFEQSVDAAKLVVDEPTRKVLSASCQSVDQLDKGGFSIEVLRAAIYFVSHSNSFDSALLPSLEFAGSANYCPVLVGSLAGAIYGRQDIKESHLNHWNSVDRNLIEECVESVMLKLSLQ